MGLANSLLAKSLDLGREDAQWLSLTSVVESALNKALDAIKARHDCAKELPTLVGLSEANLCEIVELLSGQRSSKASRWHEIEFAFKRACAVNESMKSVHDAWTRILKANEAPKALRGDPVLRFKHVDHSAWSQIQA